MIVGLCGPAGSGKDTVADFMVKNHGFVKVAFADPLKRICQDVFKFSYEQLWGPSEMRNMPDKRYRRLPHTHLLNGVAVQDPAYNEPRRCYSCGEEGPPPGNGRFFSNEECFHYLTPRHALQQLGTEWGRNCYPDIWVEYALSAAKQILSEQRSYSAEHGVGRGANEYQPTKVLGVVISDVRFANEVKLLQKHEARVVRIVRKKNLKSLEGAAGQHVSETEMQGMPDELFDATLFNEGVDLGQLEVAVKNLLMETLR